jgi:hypothetical protein
MTTTFHVSANYQTPSGNFGDWGGYVEADSHEQAMERAEAKLRADKRRAPIRKLSMSCVQAAPS